MKMVSSALLIKKEKILNTNEISQDQVEREIEQKQQFRGWGKKAC